MTFNKREFKGIQIVMNNGVQPVDQSRFMVCSQSDPEKYYRVEWRQKRWVCDCADYRKRNRKCKHIYAVNYYLKLREISFNIKSNNIALCPICNSSEQVIKRGFRYNRSGPVQRYYCKRCRKRFTDETWFKGMRNKIRAVITSLDLYYRGLSLREIKQHLDSCYGIKVSHTTVYNWIRKFVNMIDPYLQTLQIQTSERWHADETLIKVRGRHLVLWALMDSKTRYLIAYHISKRRGAEDAKALFRKGFETSANRPLEIVTDGANSYDTALNRKSLMDDAVNPLIHLKGPLTASLNNKMERFFRTVKGRLKTMYAIQGEETAETFAKGFYLYYNFIKPHRGINGKTPAQAVDLFKTKANWLDLIRKAEKASRKRPNTLFSGEK